MGSFLSGCREVCSCFQVVWYGSGQYDNANGWTRTTCGTGGQGHHCRGRCPRRCLRHWITVSAYTDDHPNEGTPGCCEADDEKRHLHRSRVSSNEPSKEPGRSAAIEQFRQYIDETPALRDSIWTLSGCRSPCYCTKVQDYHADILMDELKKQFPDANDRATLGRKPPSSKIVSFLAELRRAPESDEGILSRPGRGPQGRGILW